MLSITTHTMTLTNLPCAHSLSHQSDIFIAQRTSLGALKEKYINTNQTNASVIVLLQTDLPPATDFTADNK